MIFDRLRRLVFAGNSSKFAQFFEGVHHIAFEIKGMKEKQAALADLGMPLVQTGEHTSGRYAYVDATADLKVLIELLEND